MALSPMRIVWSLAATMLICTAMSSAANAQGVLLGAGIDRYGDLMPPGALVRLGTTRLQTKGGFAWLPDGKSLVTLKYGKVTFWDIADGRALDSFYVPVGREKNSSYGTQLALTPDGKRLVCTDTKGAVAVCSDWGEGRVSTFALPANETDPNQANLVLATLKDGQTFVTLRRTGELEFRDLLTLKVRRTVSLAGRQWKSLNPAALSPDGKTLALCDHSSIVLVNAVGDEEPVVIAKAHKGFLCNLAFLPDGKLLSSASIRREPAIEGQPEFRGELRTWDIVKRQAVADWPLDEAVSSGCSFCITPDGKQIVTVFEDRICVWDLNSQKVVQRIEGRVSGAQQSHAAVDPTGRYLAVDDHANYVRVWNLATGKALFGEGDHQHQLIGGAAWSPDGATVATGDFRDVFLWSAATGNVERRFLNPATAPWGLQFTPDGKELIICGNAPSRGMAMRGVVRWYDVSNGEFLRHCEVDGQARLPVLSPDGKLLAFNARDIDAGSSSIHVIEAATGKERASLDVEGEYAMSWLPDGDRLLAATSGSKVTQLHIPSKTVVSSLELLHMRRNQQTGELGPGRFYHAQFFRNGDRAITSGNLPEVYAWDLMTGRKQWTIPVAGFVRSMALSPDERVIACVIGGDDANKVLQLFDVGSQQKLAEFELGSEGTQCLAFSPDGRRLLVGFADGTALVMDATLRL